MYLIFYNIIRTYGHLSIVNVSWFYIHVYARSVSAGWEMKNVTPRFLPCSKVCIDEKQIKTKLINTYLIVNM